MSTGLASLAILVVVYAAFENEAYASNADQNLKDLYARLTSGRYRAPNIRRAYIPKDNGKRRPIGISTVEDRTVQKAVAWVLSAVLDQDFLDCSHGFRPNRSPHTALCRLREGMWQHPVRYVVESDLRSYFDTVNHEWLRKFVRHRVNDGGLIRLLDQWLKAGVMENGVVTHLDEGVPQGGPVSPVLSNLYLHYVLDLWFERRFKKTCRGFAELTRFADDYVATFQNQTDAERFRREMEERLTAFGLRVTPEKTAVLHFDGSLLQRRGKQGEKPATFTFLGFVHYRTKTRRGRVTVARKPSIKARERFVRKVKAWVKAHRHDPVRKQQADQEAQRPLPVLRAPLLHARTQQRAVPNPKALALGVATPQPESQTPMRLGNVARQAMVPAPLAPSDTAMGLTPSRPCCKAILGSPMH